MSERRKIGKDDCDATRKGGGATSGRAFARFSERCMRVRKRAPPSVQAGSRPTPCLYPTLYLCLSARQPDQRIDQVYDSVYDKVRSVSCVDLLTPRGHIQHSTFNIQHRTSNVQVCDDSPARSAFGPQGTLRHDRRRGPTAVVVRVGLFRRRWAGMRKSACEIAPIPRMNPERWTSVRATGEDEGRGVISRVDFLTPRVPRPV